MMKKSIVITGPTQSGKTTLLKAFLRRFENKELWGYPYLEWEANGLVSIRDYTVTIKPDAIGIQGFPDNPSGIDSKNIALIIGGTGTELLLRRKGKSRLKCAPLLIIDFNQNDLELHNRINTEAWLNRRNIAINTADVFTKFKNHTDIQTQAQNVADRVLKTNKLI